MRKALNLLLCSILGLATFAFVALPSYAQTTEDDDYTVTSDDYDYDWDYDWDSDWDSDWDYDWDYGTSYEDADAIAGLLGGGLFALTGIFAFLSIGFGLLMYGYTSFALMTIAKKLNVENGWFAWVPILNAVLLFKMGDQNPWLILLALIPGIGGLIVMVLSVIATMNIAEKRGYDKLLGLLTIIPVANLVVLGVLAWGKKGE